MPDSRTFKSVLVVDDDRSVLSALKLLLEVMQLIPTPCESGKAALAHLSTNPGVDVVLCDLRMPEMDGFAVLEAVRKSFPGLPFLLMSAHASKPEVAKAMSLGANGFVAKPFDPDELSAALRGIP